MGVHQGRPVRSPSPACATADAACATADAAAPKRFSDHRPSLKFGAATAVPIRYAWAMPRDLSEEEDTLLHWAAANGHLQVIARFCHDQVTPEHLTLDRDRYGLTPLHAAAGGGHFDQVRQICPEALTPEAFLARSRCGETPLHVAAYSRHLDQVRAVCPQALTVDACIARDNDACTVLHWAASYGQLDLVCRDAVTVENLQIQNTNGNTPLEFAIMGGHLDQVERLCPNVLTPEILLKGPYLHAAASNRHLNQVHDLVEGLVTAETLMIRAADGTTPLFLAAEAGCLGQVHRICPEALTPENLLQPLQGWTALHWAVATGDLGPIPAIDPATLPEDLRDHPILAEKWKEYLARTRIEAPPTGGAEVRAELV